MSNRPDRYPTRQGFATSVPGNNATALRLAITCTRCGALRVFDVTHAITMVHARDVAHIQIDTGCDVCGRGVQVALFWDVPGLRTTYTTLPLGDTMGVDDVHGLAVPRTDEATEGA